jgi:hypothetical protein
MTDKRRFIGLIITLICVSSNVYSSDKIYTTNFSLTESRISEGEKWINGAATGIDWTNVKTSNGNATGTQVSNFEVLYNDAVALLKGTWGADQTAEAVVHLANQTDGGISGFGSNEYGDCNKEVELYLRGTLTAHHTSLYTVTFSSRMGGAGYYETGYWVGPRGYLGNPNPEQSGYMLSHLNGAQYEIHDGDVVKATITGSTIRAYINDVLIDTVNVLLNSDGGPVPLIQSGTPGIGMFSGKGCTGTSHNDDFGFTSFTAKAPETRIPSSPSIISISP